jgi:hypothetical protein
MKPAAVSSAWRHPATTKAIAAARPVTPVQPRFVATVVSDVIALPTVLAMGLKK